MTVGKTTQSTPQLVVGQNSTAGCKSICGFPEMGVPQMDVL
jgi:hypothetical protein